MNRKIIEIFTAEAEELLQAIEQGLLVLEENPADMDRIHAVFRAAHTIKGNAGFVGLGDVVELAHYLENALDMLRRQDLTADQTTISLLLRGADQLRILVASHLEGGPAADGAVSLGIMTALAGLTGTEPPEAADARTDETRAIGPAEADAPHPEERRSQTPALRLTRPVDMTIELDGDLFSTGTDPLMLLAELADLGRITDIRADLTRLPDLAGMNPEQLYLSWRLTLQTAQPVSRLENVFVFVADSSRVTITERDPAGEPEPETPVPPETVAAEPAPQRPESLPGPPSGTFQPPSGPETGQRTVQRPTTIRVGLEKLDKLVNQVGELAISVARVELLAEREGFSSGGRDGDLRPALESMTAIVRDIQDQVMRTRMIPLEATFSRFRRLVRDTAAELDRRARLELEGMETELDRNIIEEIADPLAHLIRNAIGHGLEDPEDRIRAGKDPQGVISIKAFQAEGNIIIEVTDDGRGVDRRAVADKAAAQGLIGREALLGDRDLFDLLFHPGFSTAGQVTELSGRGVGLDVVKRNLERIRGTIEVESVAGQGTMFRIRLPITLAVIDGLTIRLGQEVLTVPMLSIIESVRPEAGEIKAVEGAGELLLFREKYIPLIRLGRVFGLPTASDDPTEGLVVVVESRDRRFGLLVDDVEGEIQAVIKSLESNYYQVGGLAGATILGDGRVSLIVDVHSLERLAFGRGDKSGTEAGENADGHV